MKRRLFIMLFTLISSFCSTAQNYLDADTLVYDLYVDEERIGEMNVIKHMSEDSMVYYTGISDVDYKILFSFHINFNYMTKFDSFGNYLSSEFTYRMNEDVKESNWVNNANGKYYVYEDNRVKKVIDKSIAATAMQLYFEEPKGIPEIFSERFCDHYEITEKQDKVYEIDFPGGNTNTYFYNDGICYKVEIDSIIRDMVFIKR